MVCQLNTNDMREPQISPDGQWVSFDNSNLDLYLARLEENSSQVSLIASRGYASHWWIHPSTAETYLIFADDGLWQTTWPPQGRTVMMKIADGSR